MRPSSERRPERVVGIPVAREILRFAAVTPSARFHENENPGPNFMSERYPHHELHRATVVVARWCFGTACPLVSGR